jgi:hypothetical protein
MGKRVKKKEIKGRREIRKRKGREMEIRERKLNGAV